MFETKIRKVGNSCVLTLSKEALAVLDAAEGDTVYLVRTDDGSLSLRRHEDDFADAMDALEVGARRYNKAMDALA
ncbi:transcriptional regulator/antitoxin MazE [Maribius pontilimi]|uniref:Transcriptional regulator/antitoxin MazE n=1 Tax=Palleronia pontilimi TaxID=1964209 RepID=A0A934MCN9_9RHOB|nr:transcriptional regulator/antitoxin MazE [Palleronia pontilimi]MBJ3762705.1 transcriptional regulator/antitoxin MazE [Palleronia pontilimi]